MATPSAVLSVLVSADTEKATAQLSKFDRQLQATTDVARKGIEARMDGRFNGEAFTKYEAALKRASTAAKDRAAFKAELGANFNNRAFNEYQRSVDKATKSTDSAAKHTTGLSKSVKGLTSSLLAAGGAFAAYEAAKEAITSTIELGHATERLSAITGLGVKQASTWIETMKVRGVQTKAVGMAFITLSRNVRTAQDADAAHIKKITDLVASQKVERAALEATGASHKTLAALEDRQRLAMDKLSGPSTSKAVAAFAELGVSQDTLKSKNTEAILLAVADGMSKIEDPTRRAALAQQIFGRGAQGLIPILAKGREGVDEALKATQRYGAYLPQNVRQLQGAVDAQHNLNLAMDGLKISFTEAVLPTLLNGADALVKFIGQMRSGSGAGGQFADAIKNAFGTVKDVVTNVVSAVGGLGNAVKIAVGAFAAVKIYEFGQALKGVFDVIKTSPVGAFFTAVGLLAGAFLALSGRQRSAAETARDVADAWNTARDSANALAQSDLQVVQAKLTVIRTNEALTAAEKAVTQAQDEHGRKSPQYKQAEENLAQAKLDSKQASLDLKTATQAQSEAQTKSTDDTKTAIATAKDQVAQDKARITSLNIQIAALGHQGGQLGQIHQLEGQVSSATQQLTTDQNNLNKAINSMPSARLSTIDLNVDFQSNMSGAIAAIAKSIGGTPLAKKPAFATHYTGGVVTQPGYFAGEEAPTHPEVILATNPAYRQRNLGLFAQAGQMLGVPGFLSGGITPQTGQEVTGAPPWAQRAASAWIKGPASSWVQGAARSAQSTLSGGLPVSVGGSVASWLAKAMSIAGVSGPAWLGMLERQVARESSGNPNAINLTDINAQRGDPSIGLLQTTGSTFASYMLPGHGNIRNPIDNSIAAIRYIIARYGHGDPNRGLAFMIANGGAAYRQGGIHGGIPGYKTGGVAAVAKKAKRYVPKTIATLTFPSKLGKVPAGSTPAITSLIGQINGVLDPNTGTASALADRITATGQIYDQRVSEYQAKFPDTDATTGLIAYTDPVTGVTTHSIDQVFVSMRVAELTQLLTWQTQLRDQLKASLARILELVARLQAAIQQRRAYAAQVRQTIQANVDKAKLLIASEKAPKITSKQKKAIAKNVTALQAQNKQLGGDTMDVGSGGVLGKVTGEIDSMNQTLGTMSDNRVAIAGASGIGGTLGAANLDLQTFADQLNVFSPAATQAALAAAAASDAASAASAGGTTPAPAGPDPALLQELLDQAHLATSVAEQQLSVLQATPPFGGSFAQGGIVPGPLGVPRTIIAHAGEAVGQPGNTEVHVHVGAGMEWLKQFIAVEVNQNTRKDARNASRVLPGRAARY